jgi:hypothetical protein
LIAVLTWSTFWIWLALVGCAGGGGTGGAVLPATAFGTASAIAVTTEAAAAAAAAPGRKWRIRDSLVGRSCIETSECGHVLNPNT